jgi:mRNA interferase HigB
MRIISESRLREFWQDSPARKHAQRPLMVWKKIVTTAAWKNPADVKRTFGKNVDFVESDNNHDLAVFNVHANHYRLIAAIHYLPHHFAKGRVYVLRILTHAEYDTNQWKKEL